MNFKTIKITLRIFDAFSLKDKRSVIKSILQKTHTKYNVSIAEVEAHDIHNMGVLGLSIVSNSALFNEQSIDKITNFIESNYELEIVEIEEY